MGRSHVGKPMETDDGWGWCQHTSGSGQEGAKELGVSIFPTYSLFNGEPRNYLEFPNHLIVLGMVYCWVYPLAMTHSLLLNMAIEIADVDMKNGDGP